MTIHARVAAARLALLAAGISADEADLDARLLADHVLGWTTEQFFTDGNRPPPPDFDARFDALVARRAGREPMAYILGFREFWGLRFEVSPAVLIPRPETELVVEAALEFVSVDEAARIADVGTGSGCLAVALARERPRATLVATDVSDAALAIARRNAERLEVADRIAFRRTDVLDGVAERFDAIVSNPPYVRDGDRAAIQHEVRFEPAGALYGGPDGLDVIRAVVRRAVDRLAVGGVLIVEFGYGQDDAVAELISSTPGLTMVALRADLQQIPRVAIARRTPDRSGAP